MREQRREGILTDLGKYQHHKSYFSLTEHLFWMWKSKLRPQKSYKSEGDSDKIRAKCKLSKIKLSPTWGQNVNMIKKDFWNMQKRKKKCKKIIYDLNLKQISCFSLKKKMWNKEGKQRLHNWEKYVKRKL